MTETRITVTNKFSGGNNSRRLTINGNCQISNYQPTNKKPISFAHANIFNGNLKINQKSGNKTSLDLSKEKYNALLKIAGASKQDGTNELSWYDLRDCNASKLNLGNSYVVKKDLKAGIFNIYKKSGNKEKTWLHIDIETPTEHRVTGTSTTPVKSIANSSKNNLNYEPKQQTVQSSKIRRTTPNDWLYNKNISYRAPQTYKIRGGGMQKGYKLSNEFGVSLYRLKVANPDINFNKPIPVGTNVKIPGRYQVTPGSVKNFNDVVKTTGISKDYIKDFLIGIEGRHKKPDLVAYYDGVRGKNMKKGALTIGFGHTGRVNGKPLTPKTRITEAQAYELLAQDILDAKVDALVYMGKVNFNKSPQSVQTGVIDIVFNKGVEPFTRKGSPTTKLKRDFEKGDYASAAANTVLKPTVKGLRKRNVYRVIMSTGDLSQSQRNRALNKASKDYKQTINMYKGSERRLMEKAWANAKRGKTSGFFN